MSTAHSVAIVVDREYGTPLESLARRVHVWICHSAVNRAAVESVWRARAQKPYDLEFGATIFNCGPDESPEEILLGVLDDVDLHHGFYSHDPPWSAIEVFGCAPTPAILDALKAFGASTTAETVGGFVAQRRTDEQTSRTLPRS